MLHYADILTLNVFILSVLSVCHDHNWTVLVRLSKDYLDSRLGSRLLVVLVASVFFRKTRGGQLLSVCLQDLPYTTSSLLRPS